MDIKNVYNAVIFASAALTIKDALVEAVSKKANLDGADLYGANLRGADLYGADLRGANLYAADLRAANLYAADLRAADLRGANLHGANLYRADLRGADLYGANLYGANLYGADLYAADLRGADLYGADLRGADLRGKKIYSIRVFTGLYDYQVWSVLFEDGSRWVKMGCLFYSLDEWEKIGIRQSNTSEFPDDGSEKCEERVIAFEFAKAVVLRMKVPEEVAAAK